MRPLTSESKHRAPKSNAKSTATLHHLKRTAENFPSLRNDYIVERTTRASFKDLKGKLHLGSIAKPAIILSKEERLNPWAKRSVISEEVLSKKGLLNLVHMGVIAKQYDCLELLNNQYELNPQPEPKAQREKETFMTNPAIMDAYYELSKKNEEEAQERIKEQAELKAIKKRSSTKKKVVKAEEPKFEFIIEDRVRLTVLNFRIDRNEAYTEYVKKLRRNGLEHLFKIYAAQLEQFTCKYNLKKVTVIPDLNETRKTTERSLLNSIVNHRLLGMDLKLKGASLEIFRWLLKAKVEKVRFRHMQAAIKKIERVKNKFKIKKFYRDMVNKRWKFLNFRLGSFAENQRRLVADNMHRNFRPEVEIHILASNATPAQLQTYYKWNERKKAQLTRLYNNECDHLILILSREDSLDHWLEDIQNAPSNWKKPRIHLFYAVPTQSPSQPAVQEYAEIYFALQPQHIQEIKRICEGRTSVIVPYYISPYLPKICETLGVNLFAGTFTEESRSVLFEEEDEELPHPAPESGSAKFKKLEVNSRDLNASYSRKFREIVLASEVLQSKTRVKQFFQASRLPTPVCVCIKDMNECDFFRELVRTILSHKQFTKWILKLPDSTFSRGLAFLETESLKIIKETKKKPFIREEDVEQIAKIIEAILVQKIYIPHNSLMNGDEFVAHFKEKEGYVESLLDNCLTLCVFGRVETNGVLTLLGSYRKYYAENICFGALYPAEQVSEEMIRLIESTCSKLYQMGVFGYLTFELLFNEKTREFYFIDLTPHLDQYSSFYFYYRRVLDINELDSVKFTNRIKRFVFYCPFIDNNGNRFESVRALKAALVEKKLLFDEGSLEGFRYLFLDQDVPSVVSLVCFSAEESGVVRHCLEGLRFLVESGGEFNKFDKKFKNNQSDGLYIMDIIWKMRQVKKEVGDK